MKLRKYQSWVVDKMIWDLGNPGNSIVCVAQGGGKSVIITHFAHKINKPILILQPSKELLEQNVSKMREYVPDTEIGIFSASMDRKDISTFTFGTIQSVYKHPEKFLDFEVAIVDECDLINPTKLSGMYNKFFKAARVKKIFGLTGTPFRQDSYYKEPPEGWALWKSRKWKNYKSLEVVTTIKMINRYKQKFWDRMLCVINTHQLMEHDYLCPLNYIDSSVIEHEEIPVNTSHSDFNWEAFEKLIVGREVEIIKGITEATKTHKSIIVFCASVQQAERLSKIFPKSSVVSAETPKKVRDIIISDFKNGGLKLVFNVSVLTVGFDHPELDCIILCRPTRSVRLHCQILGRGTRKAEGKTKCDVIDFVSNVKKIGTLEGIKITKVSGFWDVVSNTRPEGLHMKPIFTYNLKIPVQI